MKTGPGDLSPWLTAKPGSFSYHKKGLVSERRTWRIKVESIDRNDKGEKNEESITGYRRLEWDVSRRYVVYKGNSLLENLKALIAQARFSRTPIFFIQHNGPIEHPLEYGTRGWELHPEITPNDQDVIIQKTAPDSFFKTSLDDELKKQGIGQLIIAGIQTEACVDTPCRIAFSKGYKVTLVSDTHSTWVAEDLTAQQIINHHNRVLHWFADVSPSKEFEFNS